MLGPFFPVKGSHSADIDAGPDPRHRKLSEQWRPNGGWDSSSAMQQTAVTAEPAPATHQKVDAAIELGAWRATAHPAKQTDHKQAKYCAGAHTRLHAANQCDDNSWDWGSSADRGPCGSHATD